MHGRKRKSKQQLSGDHLDEELSGRIHTGKEFGDKTRGDAAVGSVSTLFTLRVCGREADKMGTGHDKFCKRAAAGH